MEIYTSYFGNLKNIPKDIVKIAICGKNPDWYQGLSYKKLAPKYSFFKEWKINKDNDYYIKHYISEVIDKISVDDVYYDLTVLSGNADKIVLLCYEKPSDFCHRHLVADWLNGYGFNVKELEYKV